MKRLTEKVFPPKLRLLVLALTDFVLKVQRIRAKGNMKFFLLSGYQYLRLTAEARE